MDPVDVNPELPRRIHCPRCGKLRMARVLYPPDGEWMCEACYLEIKITVLGDGSGWTSLEILAKQISETK
jgi:uncharacterized protein (DUF983 family)